MYKHFKVTKLHGRVITEIALLRVKSKQEN